MDANAQAVRTQSVGLTEMIRRFKIGDDSGMPLVHLTARERASTFALEPASTSRPMTAGRL